MSARVYIETTVISYLTAWPSGDLIRAAHQKITSDWWTEKRASFELFVSQAMLEEASAGDPVAAADRLTRLEGIPLLQTTDDVRALAIELGTELKLPDRAKTDALHIALSAVHGMDYLLTWNCKHIANVVLRPKIESVCRAAGFEPALICTPEELWEEV